ncbi:unnamed protein product [Effrenium voratum]|nr:unnamed protein product [Effrenium voratum]CAJ1455315.1 unnamed protein product [Effrenium voratum]|mmetsp:Transcript_97627/g.232355  ORF Transcript_97627/g.232355 Transcript_97627/m.232355 type:complete len:137 (-) Transcript_97627:58-468(-)|eukprot:CAMPEP_0181428794 /NCGR_PEP_ID=MMETSP1110-20121109/16865_1 /TAXON_ID=174948 /ORGANISM="Symbiodinium sp., Strain CCMP421" /LENGTH=136 /DNA_ID=CAMNT_0023552037 /DNA_START=120 /DNA_END=530 /DNA_ORIENTATION=+
MGCVASTADISEPESSPNKVHAANGRTLLNNPVGPQKLEANATPLPQIRHSKTGPNQDVISPTSPTSPSKSILRSKSLQVLSVKETGRRATFDGSLKEEDDRATDMLHLRSGKRRTTFGQAEIREYRVQMTQSRSF